MRGRFICLFTAGQCQAGYFHSDKSSTDNEENCLDSKRKKADQHSLHPAVL